MSRIIIVVMMLSLSNISLAKTHSKSNKSKFEQLELFNKVFHLIESQYYREVDSEKLIEGAIKGMMDTLDPHSAFLNKKVFEKVSNDTKGEFGGLGIEVTQKDGYVYIISPIEDTPAYKAGLKAGDKIVEINHESILGYTLNESVDKMKGERGTKIHLGILRQGEKEIKHFNIKRAKIKVRASKDYLINENIALIRLIQFQKNAAKSVISAIKKYQKKTKKKGGLKGIILDLRSNPGGLLDQAVDVASIFLKEGVVVSTEARDPNQKEIHYVKKTGFKVLDLPMMVLINGSSASASEIVAGALQDHGRAIIAGSQSFGKGSVQTVAKVDDENGVKLTIAQYMTPKSRKIQAVGVSPDVKLEDIDFEDFSKIKKEKSYIREKDLKNHLTATIETKEEKARRLKQEKEERLKRIARMKEREAQKNKKKKTIFTKYDPYEDFQVLQAAKFLKTIAVLKKSKI